MLHGLCYWSPLDFPLQFFLLVAHRLPHVKFCCSLTGLLIYLPSFPPQTIWLGDFFHFEECPHLFLLLFGPSLSFSEQRPNPDFVFLCRDSF